MSHEAAPAFLAFSDPFGSGAFPRATVSHVAPWVAFISLSMKGNSPALRSSRAFPTRSRLLRAIRFSPQLPRDRTRTSRKKLLLLGLLLTAGRRTAGQLGPRDDKAVVGNGLVGPLLLFTDGEPPVSEIAGDLREAPHLSQ